MDVCKNEFSKKVLKFIGKIIPISIRILESENALNLQKNQRGNFMASGKNAYSEMPVDQPVLHYESVQFIHQPIVVAVDVSSSTVRPDSLEFYDALDSLEQRSCGHYMPSYYAGPCEWDRIESLKY